MKIAVFLPNWIGDVVMATPALRAVRREFSSAEIVGVMRPYVADVLIGTGLLDRTLFHDPRGKTRRQRGWRFLRELRRERFDVALLFPNSLRSAWLAWRAGAKRRIGFHRDGRGLLLTDAVRPKPKTLPHPVLDEYNRLAVTLGCRQITRTTELTTLARDERNFHEFCNGQSRSFGENGYVCLNPGGAFGAAKHWPTASFARLAQQIVDKMQKSVLVLCGPAERDAAREIVWNADRPEQVVSLADQPLSLGLTKAAVRSSELLISTDSGPRHFAPPFDVPVVTLFGPTHIAWSETHYAQALHLQLNLDCGPCQQRVCPLNHHRCMRDLSVETVFTAAVQCLEAARTRTGLLI